MESFAMKLPAHSFHADVNMRGRLKSAVTESAECCEARRCGLCRRSNGLIFSHFLPLRAEDESRALTQLN